MVISIRKKPNGRISSKDYDYYMYNATTLSWTPIQKETLQAQADKEHLHWFGTHFVPGIRSSNEETIFEDLNILTSDNDFH